MSQITIKKINDKYLISIDYRISKIFFETDCKTVEMDDFRTGWSTTLPTRIYYKHNSKELVSYGDLTPEEYKVEVTKIGLNDADITGVEYAKRQLILATFNEAHPPIYEETELEKDIPFVIHEYTGKTDNPYIMPFRLIGEQDKAEPLYRYTADMMKMVRDVAKDYGFGELEEKASCKGKKFAFGRSNSIEYMKINDRYASDLYDTKFYSISVGTYEECSKRYELHRNIVETHFKKIGALVDSEGESFDKQKMADELSTLARLVRSISAKRKTEIEPYYVANKIDKIINELLTNTK